MSPELRSVDWCATPGIRVADIVVRAKREHPYEVPGVSARPIIDGNPDYLGWIAEVTSAPRMA